MYVGKDVTYVDADGGRRKATVLAITGAGPSENKTLTLGLADGDTAENVPHKNDAEGAAHWELRPDPAPIEPTPALVGEMPPKPKRRARRKKT